MHKAFYKSENKNFSFQFFLTPSTYLQHTSSHVCHQKEDKMVGREKRNYFVELKRKWKKYNIQKTNDLDTTCVFCYMKVKLHAFSEKEEKKVKWTMNLYTEWRNSIFPVRTWATWDPIIIIITTIAVVLTTHSTQHKNSQFNPTFTTERICFWGGGEKTRQFLPLY